MANACPGAGDLSWLDDGYTAAAQAILASPVIAKIEREAEMRERKAVTDWLRGIGFGDEDQNRAKWEIQKAIEAGEYKGEQP